MIEKIQGVIPSRVKKYASYPRIEIKFISENRLVIGFVVYEISNHYLGPVLPCDHYSTAHSENALNPKMFTTDQGDISLPIYHDDYKIQPNDCKQRIDTPTPFRRRVSI